MHPPPHIRNLLNPHDSHVVTNKEPSDNDVEVVAENVGYNARGTMHGYDSAMPVSGTPVGSSDSRKDVATLVAVASSVPPQLLVSPRSAIPQPAPRRISPVLLSSSQLGGSSARRHAGSTGVRRRTSAGHAALAEATKATGDVMVAQMKEIVGATRESESNRMEVQLKLFAEKMQYQRNKDQRLYEHGLLAAQNARLAILKQAELVQCLSTISKVLSACLMVSGEPQFHNATAAPLAATKDPTASNVVDQRDREGKSPHAEQEAHNAGAGIAGTSTAGTSGESAAQPDI
jgi:hypothetical protein